MVKQLETLPEFGGNSSSACAAVGSGRTFRTGPCLVAAPAVVAAGSAVAGLGLDSPYFTLYFRVLARPVAKLRPREVSPWMGPLFGVSLHRSRHSVGQAQSTVADMEQQKILLGKREIYWQSSTFDCKVELVNFLSRAA